MNQVILIMTGGAAGSLLRYWVSMSVYVLVGRNFPFGTLLVNVAGSFLMGLLTVLLVERLQHTDYLRAFLLIGVLGGFTTFSAFSMETLSLFESGSILKAMLNIIGSVSLCLLAVSFGAMLGRQISVSPRHIAEASVFIKQSSDVTHY